MTGSDAEERRLADEPAADSGTGEPRPDEEGPDDRPEGHLDELPDGSGCTEIWEHLSDRRADGDGADD